MSEPEKPLLVITESRLNRLASYLWEEEERMCPATLEWPKPKWEDMSEQNQSFYECGAKAVLREAVRLRIEA